MNFNKEFLDKINLTMAGKKIIVKKDSFQVFRISEENKNKTINNIFFLIILIY